MQQPCCKFKPSNQLPDPQYVNQELKTHEDIQREIDSGFESKINEYFPQLTKSQQIPTSLAVIYVHEAWIHSTNNANCHFVIMPQKQSCDYTRDVLNPQSLDSRLFETMNKLLYSQSLLGLLFVVKQDCFLHCGYLFPYLTLPHEIAKKMQLPEPQVKAHTYRMSLIKKLPQSQIVTIPKGILNINKTITTYISDKNVPQSVHVGCLVHLFVDKDYNVHLLPPNSKYLGQSNCIIWLLFKQDNNCDVVLIESLILVNNYTWLTFTDTYVKHEFQISKRFNIHYDYLTSKYANDSFINNPKTRKSHVCANQLIEMDMLWTDSFKCQNKIKCRMNNKTAEWAPTYSIANNYYQQYCLSLQLLPNALNKLYIHDKDYNYNAKQRYLNSQCKFTSMFKFSDISKQDSLQFRNETKAVELTDNAGSLIEWLEEQRKQDQWETHYWLYDNLDYQHLTIKEMSELQEYMTNLTVDFPTNNLQEDVLISAWFDFIYEHITDIIQNQWCLSIYHSLERSLHIPLRSIKKYEQELIFANGYETVIILQTDWQDHDPLVLYVNECAVVCRSNVTFLQLGLNIDMSQNHDLIIQGVTPNLIVCVLRRVPIVNK